MQRIVRMFLAVVLAALFSAAYAQDALALAPLIVIDPGHGGPYSNANANGLREKNVNLAISLELRRQLIARGYRVAMTRTTDRAVGLADRPTWNWSPVPSVWYFHVDGRTGIFNGIPKDDLQARADIANRLGADLFISIHNNGSANRSARGTETYASGRDALGVPLSRIVHNRVVYRTGLYNRRAKTTDFYVCRWTNMPAILVEGAFITNPSDAYKLKQYTFRRRIALGIAEGVHSWFRSSPFKTVVSEVSAPNAIVAAAQISASTYPTGSPVAVIARLDRWMESPTVPVLSASLGGPLLWTSGTTVPKATADELRRLAPEKIVLVGLNGAHGEEVVSAVASASALPTSAVETIEATGKAELAASIAESMAPAAWTQVMIVDEKDLDGVFSVAGPAARYRIPVLLSRNGTFTPDAQQFMADHVPHTNVAVLVGQPAAVPPSLAGGRPSTRLGGANIAARAAAANTRYYRSTARGTLSAVAADPTYGPGYLAAARYAAQRGSVLLPVWPRVLPSETRLWMTNKRPQLASFLVFDARGTIAPLMGHTIRKTDYE